MIMTAQNNEPLHIAVLGLGYVGCVSAACLADLGYRVTGIDRDAHKIDAVRDRRAPFHEPGLQDLIEKHVSSGRLSATQHMAAINDADIVLVCVGTPSDRSGNIGLDQLRRVSREIASTLAQRLKPLIVAVRSTVFPGTCEEVMLSAIAGNPMVSVVANPEFMREGTAVKDFVSPSLIVVGGENESAVEAVAALYAPLDAPVQKVSLRTAEMIKYACNAFHGLKVAFANELGSVSASLGIDAGSVLSILCKDTKLNISPAYLKPGFAFGGSCIPKDLRALTYRANQLNLRLPLLEAAIPSNQHHLSRAIEAILELPNQRLGFLGLSFKEDTDDLRESPVVTLLETLIGKGRDVRVFDPHIQLESIYGSNKNYLLQQIPHIRRLMDETADQTIAWADHLIVTQKLSGELAEKVKKSGLPVIDLTDPSLAYILPAESRTTTLELEEKSGAAVGSAW